MAAWNRLKRGVGEAERTRGSHAHLPDEGRVACASARAGPTAVVYPEGRWYAGLAREALDRVIAEDLGEGRPVEDHC